MKLPLLARFFLVGALFLAIFIGLVVLQYPLGGPFAHTAGVVQFRGRFLSDEKTLDLVEISAHGLVFLFSSDKPLQYRTATARNVNAVPVAYAVADDGFTVRFDEGSRFVVTADASGNVNWQFEPVERLASVKLAYRLTRNVSIALDDKFDGMYLTAAGTQWAVSNLRGADETDRVEFRISQGRPLPVRMLVRDVSPALTIAQLLPQSVIAADVWNAEIDNWLEKSWRALSGSRFSLADAEWQSSGGGRAYSNQALLMHMAELMKRGQYELAANLVSTVRNRHLAAIDWRASAFAGNLAVAMQAREEADLVRAQGLASQLAQGSLDIFDQPDLVHFVYDRAPNLVTDFSNLARRTSFTDTPVARQVRLLEHYLALRQYLPESQNPLSQVLALAEPVINSFIQTERGFFLPLDTDGRVDSLLMLQAGVVLLQLGEQRSQTLFTIAGQSLVSALLQQTDANGALPQSFTVQADKVQASVAKLEAEVLYPYLVRSPYYPRAITYYGTIGPGTWVWTASPSFTLSRTSDTTTFTAEYPLGSYHFVALYGIQAFRNMQLYNINYNMDASFERYNASGYFYKRPAQIAYVKMSHRSERESIRFLY